MISRSPPRKKPSCHTCGLPMAGHRRVSNRPVCPEERSMHLADTRLDRDGRLPIGSSSDPSSFYPSPAGSPVSKVPGPLKLPAISDSSIWEELPDGGSRWRNPNWRTPTPTPISLSYSPKEQDDDVASNASTELIPVDENIPPEPIKHSPVSPIIHRRPFMALHMNHNGIPFTHHLSSPSLDEEDPFCDDIDEEDHTYVESSNSDSDSSSAWSTGSFINDILRGSLPLATVFRTHQRNYAQIQEAAESRGYSVGLLTRPDNASVPIQPHLRGKARLVQNERAIWLVVGQSQEAVGYLMDMQRELLPRQIDEFEEADKQLIQRVSYQQQFWTFVKMTLAGAIGGLIAVWGVNICR